MQGIMEVLHEILGTVVEISTLFMEFAGIIVLITTGVKCFYRWVRRTGHNVKLELGQGIALALGFKMGGEVLRTVVVRQWSELGILGAIIILRAGLTFLIHKEISEEKKEEEKKKEDHDKEETAI